MTIHLDNKAKRLIGIAVIGTFLFFSFILMPYLQRRKVDVIVKSIMAYWVKSDSGSGVTFWHDKAAFPPIYDLMSYKVEGKTFGKKGGKKHAVYYLNIKFYNENVLPSDRTWVCAITDTKYGWKVTDFYIIPE